MTVGAKQRKEQREKLYPLILHLLQTQSAARFKSRPSQLRVAARQIAFRLVAIERRVKLAQAVLTT